MSMDVTGTQTVSQDHGKFIQIPFKYGIWRIREQTLIGYATLNQSHKADAKPENHFILRIDSQGAQVVGLEYETEAEMIHQAERLDWYFRKEQR